MEFVFQTGPCDRSELIPQLAQALDLRMEAVSKKKQSRFRKAADKPKETPSEELLKRKQIRNKILGFAFLIIGAVLAVPGFLAGSGLNTGLIGGAMAIIIGITFLTPQSQGPSRRTIALAQKLLNMRNSGPSGELHFAAEGLNVNGGKIFPYDRIETVVETEDLYLFVLANGALFLIKDDCLEGDPAAFTDFLQQQLGARFVANAQTADN